MQHFLYQKPQLSGAADSHSWKQHVTFPKCVFQSDMVREDLCVRACV